jgi:hypothetical protein
MTLVQKEKEINTKNGTIKGNIKLLQQERMLPVILELRPNFVVFTITKFSVDINGKM